MTERVADLTVEELRDLLYDTMRQLVEEVVEEKLGMLTDPRRRTGTASRSRRIVTSLPGI